MTKLTPEQQTTLEQWAADGATLNDVQQRLKSEFDISITYMEARLLLIDLQVKIKDKVKEVPKAAEPAPVPTDGGITMTVDSAPISGSIISGKVTFSDGVNAAWYLDEMGRPGLKSQDPAYQPPPQDIPAFQKELDRVLGEAGV
jgi:hypothetical protein